MLRSETERGRLQARRLSVDSDVAPPAGTYRLVAWLAISGAVLLLLGTGLHPGGADPADSRAAFDEYAATGRGRWVASHLVQLAGVVAMVLAIRLLTPTRGAAAGVIGMLCSATVAVAVTLQAVDGVGLKAMVDAESAAVQDDRKALFAAALAVRQIEIGLDALLGLLVAATLLVYAVVLFKDAARALAALAVFAGLGTFVTGLLMALEGYSSSAMLVSTVGGLSTVVLMLALAIWCHRRGRKSTPQL